jgi:hypothetical protein
MSGKPHLRRAIPKLAISTSRDEKFGARDLRTSSMLLQAAKVLSKKLRQLLLVPQIMVWKSVTPELRCF